MLEQAIQKINNEMKNNNPYVLAVGGFLLPYLNKHPEAAEKIMNNDKTIAKSLDEMRKAAKKKKIGNCAVLTDQEGFEVVLKYFGIEDPVNIPSTPATEPKPDPVPEKKSTGFNIKLEDLL